MRLLPTLLGSCLVVFAVAACGGDKGDNNNDECGDGQKTGSEQCDDGNTTSGDGCSSTCRNESSGVCGDGNMTGAEECDDGNTTPGDGCSATCMDEGGPNRDCGNGQIDGTEECDDNNGVQNDGCTACEVDDGWTCNDAEPSVCTQTPLANGSCQAAFPVTLTADADGDLVGHAIGDTTGGMDHQPEGVCGDSDTVGGGNDVVYTFTLATAADLSIMGPEDRMFDMVIRLSTTPCSIPTEVADDINASGCSDDSGELAPEELYYVNVPAGTYYLTVDGYDSTDAGMFDVTIIAFGETTCGNGVLDGGEDCDDMNTAATDGCDARCNVETGYVCDTSDDPSVCALSCGNGTFEEELEECEPTTDNDDICNANCTLVSDVMETEPNDTAAQATTLTEANHRVRGTLSSTTDVDVYKFTLTQPAFVEFETYDSSDADATNYFGVGTVPTFDCYDDDTELALFAMGADITMDAMALAVDDNDGDTTCSYLGALDDDGNADEGLLEPGTYFVRVTGSGSRAYILDMFITPSVAPAAGDLVINEVMPADGTFDTNCDTDTNGEADEFVEIVNKSNKFLTINGMRINDSTALRHTFAPGATGFVGMLPGESVVVWAGGAPACTNVFSFFTASSGSLVLGNSGDTVNLLPPGTGTTPLETMTFGSATNGFSLNLNPDLTGTTYARHDTITGHVGNYSPGRRVNGTAF